jgi:hypothetical protein
MHRLLWAALFVATVVTAWSLVDYASAVYRGLKTG